MPVKRILILGCLALALSIYIATRSVTKLKEATPTNAQSTPAPREEARVSTLPASVITPVTPKLTTDKTLPYDSPTTFTFASTESTELIGLKKMTSAFALAEFLELAQLKGRSPFEVSEFSLDEEAGGAMTYQGSSKFGEELIVKIKRGDTPENLVQAYAKDREIPASAFVQRSSDSSVYWALQTKEASTLLRVGRTNSGDSFMLVWQRPVKHSSDDVATFNSSIGP